MIMLCKKLRSDAMTVKIRKKSTIQECMKAVEEQPTAFDVENVVSNLEQLELDGACNNENCVNCQYYGDCVAGEKREELALDKAIEIVKRGGTDEE